MNAIIISAVWGIIMMFSGVFVKSKTAIRNLASYWGWRCLLIGNYADWMGHHLLVIEVHKMIVFRRLRVVREQYCICEYAVAGVIVGAGHGEGGA